MALLIMALKFKIRFKLHFERCYGHSYQHRVKNYLRRCLTVQGMMQFPSEDHKSKEIVCKLINQEIGMSLLRQKIVIHAEAVDKCIYLIRRIQQMRGVRKVVLMNLFNRECQKLIIHYSLPKVTNKKNKVWVQAIKDMQTQIVEIDDILDKYLYYQHVDHLLSYFIFRYFQAEDRLIYAEDHMTDRVQREKQILINCDNKDRALLKL